MAYKKSYRAVVYFHGIGTQRRHEEISRLIDAIDIYTKRLNPYKIGTTLGQKVKFESSRTSSRPEFDQAVSFIEFQRRVKPYPKRDENIEDLKWKFLRGYYRIYEGYWSPLIAKGVPGRHVMTWFTARFFTPWKSLFAKWRTQQRLKLGYLFRLQSQDPKARTRRRKAIYENLADAYVSFEKWGGLRDYDSSYLQFCKFIDETLNPENRDDGGVVTKRENEDYASTKEVMRRWYWTFKARQAWLGIIFLSIFAGLFGAVTFGLFSVAPLITADIASAINIPGLNWALQKMPAKPPTWLTYVMAPVLVFGAALFRKFIKGHASDVVFWTAQEGKSELYEMREAILEEAVEKIQHVLKDPDCESVVVMGHSLGSSIGYQALVEIGKRRRAMGWDKPAGKEAYPCEKITHFITAGSPIETLHYFFEATTSKFHRFRRISDEIRGSSQNLPFASGNVKKINWINMHAAADPISSKLFAPGKTRMPKIEEVEVVSQFYPHVTAAHSGYFSAAPSVGRLHDVIVMKDEVETDPGTTYRFTRPIARWAVKFIYGLSMLSAWVIFISGVLFWKGETAWMNFGLKIFLILAASMALIWAGLRVLNWLVPLGVWPQNLMAHRPVVGMRQKLRHWVKRKLTRWEV